jgi:hypothetical protein
MAAVANNPKFAKKAGVPQSVGQEFIKADKGRKFSEGGDMASKMNPGMMAIMAKKKSMKMASGGMPMKDGKPAFLSKGNMAKGGMAKGGMAKGGLSAGHKQADGIAMKGKTRGMEVKMAKGGKAGKC